MCNNILEVCVGYRIMFHLCGRLRSSPKSMTCSVSEMQTDFNHRYTGKLACLANSDTAFLLLSYCIIFIIIFYKIHFLQAIYTITFTSFAVSACFKQMFYKRWPEGGSIFQSHYKVVI